MFLFQILKLHLTFFNRFLAAFERTRMILKPRPIRAEAEAKREMVADAAVRREAERESSRRRRRERERCRERRRERRKERRRERRREPAEKER